MTFITSRFAPAFRPIHVFAPADAGGAGGMGASSAAGTSIDDIAKSMIAEGPKDAEQKPSAAGAPDSAPAQMKRPAAPAVVSNGPAEQRGAPTDHDDAYQTEDGAFDDDIEDDDADDTNTNAGDGAAASQQAGEGDDDGDPLDALFGDADHDGAAGSDDGPVDASKLGDDVKLSVTVDGEEREVTIGELKRRYAGEGAIEKRLQQVTETRKKVFEDYEKQTALATSVMQNLGQLLFRRTIAAPSEDLWATNPADATRRQRAFDQEGLALQNAQQQLYGLMQQLDGHMEEQRSAVRMSAAQELKRIMPAIADPVRGPKLRTALVDAAKEIGYTEQDIANCTDPLMFKTMALAARELRRMKGTQVQKQKENPRTMKPAAAKSMAGPQRRQQSALAKARETGNIDDIAASMIVQPRRRKGRKA